MKDIYYKILGLKSRGYELHEIAYILNTNLQSIRKAYHKALITLWKSLDIKKQCKTLQQAFYAIIIAGGLKDHPLEFYGTYVPKYNLTNNLTDTRTGKSYKLVIYEDADYVCVL